MNTINTMNIICHRHENSTLNLIPFQSCHGDFQYK